MPCPAGLTVAEVSEALRTIAARTRVAGLGLTGLAPDGDPATLAEPAAAAGL
jgi:arginase family enzyme